jgi:hypothetical protein
MRAIQPVLLTLAINLPPISATLVVAILVKIFEKFLTGANVITRGFVEDSS